jgi:pimeloyl-ACP methyl ester carboxylesterase
MNSPKTVRPGENDDHWLWPEYYQAFPDFSAESVRAGCHPRKMLHPASAEQAIVLVHGLTDSPYFMSAMGEYFHNVLGYDVYLPLLQCHGLKFPQGMAGVALGEWLENVGFAIRSAAQRTTRVSIGGLSTGGALGYYLACIDPMITGDLYLFSAALGLPAGPCGIPGRLKEWLLRLPFVGRLDSSLPLVGNNPYRYDRVSLNSAAELAKLIMEIDHLPRQFADTGNPSRRIFAAWSECDNVVSLDKLYKLQRRIPADRFMSFIIPAADGVEHACVVLQQPIHALGAKSGSAPLERANPRFAEMLAAIVRFAVAA